MMNLRSKLFAGFGGLLALLLVVSILGVAVITWYSRAIERVLRENYRSVVYGQKMIDAAGQLTSDAQSVVFDNVAQDRVFTDRAKTARAEFETNLQEEHDNITLPGEQNAADELTARWNDFRTQLDATLQPTAPKHANPESFKALLSRETDVKRAAQAIVDMNLNNMVSVNGQAKHWATLSRSAMYILLGAGFLLGVMVMAVVSRSILAPIKALTRSVKEIESGNLNLVVQSSGRDEIGQLGEAFNAMAARLREFRRTDQAKLLRTQQTMQLAIDSLPDAVAVVNPEGVIELANGTARRLFNLTADQPLEALGHAWLTDLFRVVRDTARAYEPQGYLSAVQMFDNGTERFFLPQGVPIRGADTALVGVTVVLIDVTRLRQLDELKSSLVSTVSHELRTPLTAIRLANHLLISNRIGPLTAKQSEVVIESRDNADRLQGIIDNLLDMSRIETGRTALEFAPCSPHQLAVDAADSQRGMIQDHGIQLHIDVPVDLPKVRADRTRIDHVLTNLLSNATRYTPAGGSISIDATADDGQVTFAVSDTGSGIPKAYQSRVFERFFRVPGQNGQGVGLGLAIAREIVLSHGGMLTVESAEGVGTTFRFTLPFAEAPVAEPVAAGHREEMR
jgi:NtrC-family two-component system sensor histidine kinase KinB